MATVAAANLSRAALDWAVAQIEGESVVIRAGELFEPPAQFSEESAYNPSSNWEIGGAIVEREGIALRKSIKSGTWYAMAPADVGERLRVNWSECAADNGLRYGPYSLQGKTRRKRFSGTTMLEAAMRCHVASRLGQDIEIPDALTEPERS